MKLLVLDGNSILNRAFYGIKLLTTKSGEFTNGIVGFLNILEKVKDETEPDAVAIAFDMKAPTFRHKAYAGYKAQRKGMPPELAARKRQHRPFDFAQVIPFPGDGRRDLDGKRQGRDRHTRRAAENRPRIRKSVYIASPYHRERRCRT